MNVAQELRDLFETFEGNTQRQAEILGIAASLTRAESKILLRGEPILAGPPRRKVPKKVPKKPKPTKKAPHNELGIVVDLVDDELHIIKVDTKGWVSVEDDQDQARLALQKYNKDHTVALGKQLRKLIGLKPGDKNPFWPKWKTAKRKDIAEIEKRGYKLPSKLIWNLRVNEDEDGTWVAKWRSLNGKEQSLTTKKGKEQRNSKKFDAMRSLMKKVPKARKGYNKDLAGKGFTKERVRAGVVFLLDTLGIRVGSDRHTKKGTRGAASLMLEDIVSIRGGKVKFKYVAKAAKSQNKQVNNKQFAELVRELKKVKRKDLKEDDKNRVFLYQKRADGPFKRLKARDVNAWMKSLGLGTAKDFRTLRANQVYMELLNKHPHPGNLNRAEAIVKMCVEEVAKVLGNKPAETKSSYLSSDITEGYLAGLDMSPSDPPKGKKPKGRQKSAGTVVIIGDKESVIPKGGLSKEEDLFLKRLKHLEDQFAELGISIDKDY